MGEAGAVLAWGALLAVLASGLALWAPHAELQWGPLAGAAAASWLGGLALLRRRRERDRTLPDLSLPVVVLGIGFAATLNGAYLGRWLVLIGAGIVLLGLAGLVRELRAQRRRRSA
jgi:hypothetical protein